MENSFQMTKERRWDNSEWPNWLNEAWQMDPGEGAVWIDDNDPLRNRLVLGTSEGVQRIVWGDWLTFKNGKIEVRYRK